MSEKESVTKQPIEDEGFGRVSQSCEKRGGIKSVGNKVIYYLILWIAMWVIGVIVGMVGGGLSFTGMFNFVGMTIWGIIALIINLLGLLFFVIMLYYVFVYFFSCKAK